MSIRRYQASDQGAVIRLFREFMSELTPPEFSETFQTYVEQAIAEELGRIEEYYFCRDDQGFWVADADDVVGMVGIEHREDQAAELRRMAVQRAQRRKGIARELLATAEAQLRPRLPAHRAEHLRAAGRGEEAIRVERLSPGARRRTPPPHTSP